MVGAQAEVIQSILRNSLDHPHIERARTQQLIWAILARAEFENLSTENQIAATQLLTPLEIAGINRSVVDLIPSSIWRNILGDLSIVLRLVIEAENELRNLLTTADSTYQPLERVAMLTGAVPLGVGSRDIPRERWSYHTDGYFVRIRPAQYTNSRLEVFNPAPVEIAYDQWGRVVLLENSEGYKIETYYRDEEPILVAEDPLVYAHRFDYVRLRGSNISTSAIGELVVPLDGWTFVHSPDLVVEANARSWLAQWITLTVYAQRNYLDPSQWERLQGYEERWNQLQDAVDMVNDLNDSFQSSGAPISDRDRDNFMNLGHYQHGLNAALNPADISGRSEWTQKHSEVVLRGWAWAINDLGGISLSGGSGADHWGVDDGNTDGS